MKFDCAILNPPYDRNLHLKILEQVITKADKVVNISPVRWLQDPFAPYSTRSDYCKFEDSVSKKIETLDVIPAKEASELFDAKFVMNLGIYVCGNGGYEYCHNDPMITKIVQKTMTSNWEPFSWRREQQVKPYKLICSYVAGSATAGFDYLVCKTYEAQLKSKPTNPEWKPGGHDHREFYFDTEVERYNFWSCYNHPFMRWWARQWKADFAIRANQVPYFADYTHPWDYQEFFAWFELTEEEQERVMQEIVISEKLNS